MCKTCPTFWLNWEIDASWLKLLDEFFNIEWKIEKMENVHACHELQSIICMRVNIANF